MNKKAFMNFMELNVPSLKTRRILRFVRLSIPPVMVTVTFISVNECLVRLKYPEKDLSTSLFFTERRRSEI